MYIPREPSQYIIILLLGILVFLGYQTRNIVGEEYYYNPDEMGHVQVSTAHNITQVLKNSKFEMHPPLGPALRYMWMEINDSPNYVRLLSKYFSIATIILYFFIGKNISCNSTGLISAYLATFSYGNVVLSQVARNYTILVFFISTALFCYLLYRKQKKELWLVCYVVFAFFAIATHFGAIVPIISIFIIQLWDNLKNKHHDYNFKLWVVINIALGLFFIYFYSSLSWTLEAYRSEFGNHSFLKNVVRFFPLLTRHIIYILPPLSFNVVGFLSLLWITIFIYSVIKLRKKYVHLVNIILVLLLLSFILHVTGVLTLSDSRRNFALMPFIILPISLLLANVIKGNKLYMGVLTTAAIGAIALLFNSNAIYFKNSWELSLTRETHDNFLNFKSKLRGYDAIIVPRLYSVYFVSEGDSLYNHLPTNFPKNPVGIVQDGKVITFFHLKYTRFINKQVFISFIKELEQQKLLDNYKKLWFINGRWEDPIIKRILGCGELEGNYSFALSNPELTLFSIPKNTLLNDILPMTGKYHHCLDVTPKS